MDEQTVGDHKLSSNGVLESGMRTNVELKSVKPYRSQDEYLYAMKEDLADWFNVLYDLSISVDDFFEQLETGVVLCQHANSVCSFVAENCPNSKDYIGAQPSSAHNRNGTCQGGLSDCIVSFRSRGVQPGTFQARDNLSNFIRWCRIQLGIPDTLLFETEDLVSRKNERNVVLCLLEVARRGSKFGMLAPTLIQFETEIDAEIAEALHTASDAESMSDEKLQSIDSNKNSRQPPGVGIIVVFTKRPVVQVDMMSLDEMVRHILSRCTCPDQFPMVRVSEGKYKIGDALTLIFLRILRNHVMVRIGGGWDTLESYLDRHDPCRCNSKEHRGTRAFTATNSSNSTVPDLDSSKRQSSPLIQGQGPTNRS